LKGGHVFSFPYASCLSTFRAPDGGRPQSFRLVVGGTQLRGTPSEPRMGDARNPSALSSEERNFVEVGTFHPSFGFKDFHHAARLHPLAGGHPRW
jgi:hypothetical protein